MVTDWQHLQQEDDDYDAWAHQVDLENQLYIELHDNRGDIEMAFELNDMSGNLFRNEKKESAKQPDYTGKVKIRGEELRVAAWLKDGKKGKYFSFKFSEPQGESKPTSDAPF